jgi:hypothetical protein
MDFILEKRSMTPAALIGINAIAPAARLWLRPAIAVAAEFCKAAGK